MNMIFPKRKGSSSSLSNVLNCLSRSYFVLFDNHIRFLSFTFVGFNANGKYAERTLKFCNASITISLPCAFLGIAFACRKTLTVETPASGAAAVAVWRSDRHSAP